WFLMLGLVFAFGVGIALMSLRVASYAQVKAFYGLPALLPLCALVVAGWDFLEKRIPVSRPFLWVALITWGITTYAAFSILSGSRFTYTVRGVGLADDKRYAEAAAEFSHALRLDPNSLPGRVGLAKALIGLNRRDEARQQSELALKAHPEASEAQIQTA